MRGPTADSLSKMVHIAAFFVASHQFFENCLVGVDAKRCHLQASVGHYSHSEAFTDKPSEILFHALPLSDVRDVNIGGWQSVLGFHSASRKFHSSQ